MNKERILKLADRVGAYEKFDQNDNDHCVVALAEKMMDEEKFQATGRWNEKVGQFLGLTANQVMDILVANYKSLGVGEDWGGKLLEVTREIAASALRELVARG